MNTHDAILVALGVVITIIGWLTKRAIGDLDKNVAEVKGDTKEIRKEVSSLTIAHTKLEARFDTWEK